MEALEVNLAQRRLEQRAECSGVLCHEHTLVLTLVPRRYLACLISVSGEAAERLAAGDNALHLLATRT